MYTEKTVKRIFPPTPERLANKWYKAYKYISTFTTIFVVIITAHIAYNLHQQGIKIKVVGSLPDGTPSLERGHDP